MQAIYTRTMRVKDDMLGKAMEIGKGKNGVMSGPPGLLKLVEEAEKVLSY